MAKLLQFPDHGVVAAGCMALYNLTRSSRPRLAELVSSLPGIKVMTLLLEVHLWRSLVPCDWDSTIILGN